MYEKKLSLYLTIVLTFLLTACTSAENSEGDARKNDSAQQGKDVQKKLLWAQARNFQIYAS